MNYDKKDVLAVADAFVVANNLGIETKKRGRNIFIHCPAHLQKLGRVDNTADNCVITKHGYHCFACGHHGDVIDLVEKHLNCSFLEALDTVANIYGGPSAFKNKTHIRRNTLSSSDLSLIGLNPTHNPDTSDAGRLLYNTAISQQEEADRIGCTHKHKEYVMYKKVGKPSLQELYDTDKIAYYSLIERNAKEAAFKYKQAAVDYGSHYGAKAGEILELFQMSPNDANNVFKGICEELERKRKRALEIHREYKRLKEEAL